ncbi:ABC transporter permease [Methylobacterium organophilum]|uniref:Polysialic acid transport protein KpsM n=1 Tax=Methylobacterium organophilum TaxID=410 RepID=A0ABQ4THB8_METOR|nr:ABC transporter [Methylobacterium organophilum]UMY17552.1 ABC transporter [Methylobacterium organophilum]GJE29717.1 Polysialic acid transport protein KpsM [Methylobacterium organophilum]
MSLDLTVPKKQPLTAIDTYCQVVGALMLRDMQTRFGATRWGWGVQVLWPVTHVMIIAAVMAFRHMPSPIGDSALIFAATGAAPALVYRYIAREVMKGFSVNRPLTYFPQVSNFAVFVSRCLNEIIGSFLGLAAILAIIAACGVDPLPIDTMQALTGYLVAIVFGIGLGGINVGIVSVFPGWNIGFILFSILIYFASGVMFLPSYLPPEIYWWMKWLPPVQYVEWVRLGYDPGLDVEIDYLYTITATLVTLAVGLAMERYISRSQGT